MKKQLVALNKFIAHAGVCSRRKAADLVRSGVVTVNDIAITEAGYKVNLNDVVKVQGKIIKQEQLVYILLNKPKDYITTLSDQKGRRTVMDLVKDAAKERIYPVGRLDRNTTGLLLLTNDGALTHKLAHPSYEVQKMYHVVLDKVLKIKDGEKIKVGVELEDGIVPVDELYFVENKPQTNVRLVLHSGKYRVVRRLFASLGYEVITLDRVQYAGLTKKGLLVGMWRFLTNEEVQMLKALVFEFFV